MESDAVLRLPRRSELGAPALGFLESRFSAREDLVMATDLASEIDSQCARSEADLHSLKRKLGSLIVSWSSRSIHARASAENLNLSLENLSLLSSQYENRSVAARKFQGIVGRDLPFIVKELKRIKALREYAESALKLEALVGDLEDAVLCALNQRTANLQHSSGKHANVLNAVRAINSIEDLLLNIAKLHPQWHHLLKIVDSRIDKILAVLRPQVVADHRGVLASLGWPPKVLTSGIGGGAVSSIPNPLLLMQKDKRESYSQSFLALCALQHVQKRRDDRPLVLSGQKKDGYICLWAIDELVSPIASRVEHHFLKWIDQPEFIFALAFKITRDFIEGVDDVLQPLIDKARLVSCSAKEAWVFAMVQMLSGFLVKRLLPELVARYKEKHSKEDAISSWLHVVDNIISFDKRVQSLLRSETSLFQGEFETPTDLPINASVLSLFHDRPNWLHIWAKVEVKDAWKKLKFELKQERAWFTDQTQTDNHHGFLLSTREDFKAPPIAEFALKITWHMIERCQTLPASSARIKFIRSGAVKFLWHFFHVMLSRFQNTGFPAYNTNESLISVCQLINMARFCESKLQQWGDDVNFLELRAFEKGPNSGSFFNEEIKGLAELQTNWLSEIIAEVLRQFESYSFEYFDNIQSLAQSMDNAANGVSDDLGGALDILRGQLLLIKRHLNMKDFFDLWRNLAEGLDLFVFQTIISSNARFSNGGATQLDTDLRGLLVVFGCLCARPEAFFPCIRDLLRVVKLGREDLRCLKSLMEMNTGDGVRKWLMENGILGVTGEQVLMILSKRIFSV